MISGTPPTSPALPGSSVSVAPAALAPGVPVSPSATPGATAALPHGPAPWSPKALAGMSFFFTFLPAGIMYGMNYERLGQPKKKALVFAVTAVAFVLFAIAVVMTPDTGPFQYVFRGFHVAVVFFFLKSPQALLYQQYIVNGGQPGKLTKPILASVGFLVLLLGALFGWGWMEAGKSQEQYDVGFEMINQGQLAQAEALFLRLKEEAPEDVDPYWGLANIYVRMERYDEAKRELAKTLELAPDLKPALELREALNAPTLDVPAVTPPPPTP